MTDWYLLPPNSQMQDESEAEEDEEEWSLIYILSLFHLKNVIYLWYFVPIYIGNIKVLKIILTWIFLLKNTF
jgi:hypothetical protein